MLQAGALLMIVPDEFSRDMMDSQVTSCARCLEMEGLVGKRMMRRAWKTMRRSQSKQRVLKATSGSIVSLEKVSGTIMSDPSSGA
jgi:hypothetical protein